MPAYNFKGQFAAAVEAGTKPHTIRPVRKRPTVKGDSLYLYTGMRQRGCRILRTCQCLAVTPVVIHARARIVYMPCHNLSLNYRDGFWSAYQLARYDGFLDLDAFFGFFLETYGDRFAGELIEWLDLSAPVSQPSTLSSQPRA